MIAWVWCIERVESEGESITARHASTGTASYGRQPLDVDIEGFDWVHNAVSQVSTGIIVRFIPP